MRLPVELCVADAAKEEARTVTLKREISGIWVSWSSKNRILFGLNSGQFGVQPCWLDAERPEIEMPIQCSVDRKSTRLNSSH